jgi:hypothetical protein
MMPEYNGVPAQSQPQHQQLMYHLHPGGYVLPASQPGFFVQQDEVVPYTFEPIPFDQYYHGHRQAPPQNPERYADLSSKNQPAVAVMAPAEYHHVGVSEAELAEMWAMLEDDNGTTGAKHVVNQVQVRATTGNSARNDINEEDMESYSNLPGESRGLILRDYRLTCSFQPLSTSHRKNSCLSPDYLASWEHKSR